MDETLTTDEPTDEKPKGGLPYREEVNDILDHHRWWVDRERPHWRNHRDSFMDNFWRDAKGAGFDADVVSNIEIIPLFAVNRMKAWVTSYIASLFYRGFSADIQPDDLVEADDPIGPRADLVKVLLDRWFNAPSFARITEQAFTAALLYPHAAFYLSEDARARRDVDRVRVEFMPPWECVWDRLAASPEEARYMGRAWWLPIEEAEQRFGLKPELAAIHRCAKPDVLTEGWLNLTGRPHADKNYVRILDITFPLMPATVGEATVRGKRCVYLLDQSGTPVEELQEGPVQWQDADGLPECNVVPVVLTSLPEAPLYGIANAATIYALERENNTYAAWVANAFRFEALRRLFLDISQLAPGGPEAATSSPLDNTVVKVKPGGLAQGAKSIASWMDPAPSPPSGLALRQFVESHFEAVSGTAPFTRGQPTQYIPATESANLSAYSETTLGLLRGKMDRAVAALGARYLRALWSILKKRAEADLPVRRDKKIELLPISNLSIRWQIRITDGANTPAKTESEKRDALQLAPLLVQMASSINNPQAPMPPEATEALKGVWNETVKRFGLDLNWTDIQERALQEPEMPPPVEPPAPPPPAPPPPPAGLTAEQDVAVMSDEQAAADLANAFGLGGM